MKVKTKTKIIDVNLFLKNHRRFDREETNPSILMFQRKLDIFYLLFLIEENFSLLSYQ